MCFDLSDEKGMQWSVSIGSYTSSTIVREPWQDFSRLLVLRAQPLIIVQVLVFLILTWVISLLTSMCNWLCQICQISLLFIILTTVQSGLEFPSEVHWLPLPKWLMHIFTKSSGLSEAICEAPGSLKGFKIIHNNLTNPYYLMLKWEGPPEKTFGVKNIWKSELRP